ncbi:MAG: hypothetical protein AAF298_23745 [Cyanobacteria bacterium P01_A01_bin.40]
MPKKDPIESFGVAGHVANFLLYESFRYAHDAAQYEVASILFGKKLKNIEPVDSNWEYPEIPQSLDNWIINQGMIIDSILDPKTTKLLSDAWYSSLKDASTSKIKISKSRQLSSTTDIVGHIVNLTICLEASLNRHLFYLRESQQLEAQYYASIDRSELMPKILFCFKEQIVEKTVHIDRIKQLVSMRNRSVHYRVDSPESLQPYVEDLLGIWHQLGQLFDLMYGEPNKSDIHKLANNFTTQWVV